MTITIILDGHVAEDLAGAEPFATATRRILDVLDRYEANLIPLDPEALDPILATMYAADVGDAFDPNAVAQSLRELEGVEAAYVKPDDASP